MNITRKQLRRIIKEEINEMVEMQDKLAKLLNSEDEGMIMSGIDIATTLGMPIIIKQRPPRGILTYVKSLSDPELLAKMAEPQTHKLIQIAIAKNQNTPIDVIKKMATGLDYNIRAANYATQGLDLYCGQNPDDKVCLDHKTKGYRN